MLDLCQLLDKDGSMEVYTVKSDVSFIHACSVSHMCQITFTVLFQHITHGTHVFGTLNMYLTHYSITRW